MSDHGGKTVFKNASFLLVSQAFNWLLAIAITVILPRYLGPARVGQLHLADSIWGIAIIFVGFGMETLLTKEIARQPARTGELIATSLLLRVLLYVVVFGGVLGYANLAGYDPLTIQIIIITGLGQLFATMGTAFQSALEGLETMKPISIGASLSRFVYTGLGLLAVFLGADLLTIAGINVVAAVTLSTFLYFNLRRVHTLRWGLDGGLMRWMLRASVPYMLTFLFSAAYVNVDVIVISLLVDDGRQIGWYTAADRLFGTTMFLPAVFTTAIFPLLSRLHAQESNSLGQVISRSYNFLLLFSIPIGLGLVAISTPVAILIYGAEFAPTGQVLAVIGIVLILTYQNTLMGRFFISIDRQTTWTYVMAVATLATIPLDLLLIPWTASAFGNGAIGGALAYVFTEGGMTIFGLLMLPRGYLRRENLILALKAVTAGLVMMGAVWFVRDQFIVIPILLGMIVYPAMIFALRTIPREDVQLLQEAGRSILLRLRAKSQAS